MSTKVAGCWPTAFTDGMSTRWQQLLARRKLFDLPGETHSYKVSVPRPSRRLSFFIFFHFSLPTRCVLLFGLHSISLPFFPSLLSFAPHFWLVSLFGNSKFPLSFVLICWFCVQTFEASQIFPIDLRSQNVTVVPAIRNSSDL